MVYKVFLFCFVFLPSISILILSLCQFPWERLSYSSVQMSVALPRSAQGQGTRRQGGRILPVCSASHLWWLLPAVLLISPPVTPFYLWPCGTWFKERTGFSHQPAPGGFQSNGVREVAGSIQRLIQMPIPGGFDDLRSSSLIIEFSGHSGPVSLPRGDWRLSDSHTEGHSPGNDQPAGAAPLAWHRWKIYPLWL